MVTQRIVGRSRRLTPPQGAPRPTKVTLPLLRRDGRRHDIARARSGTFTRYAPRLPTLRADPRIVVPLATIGTLTLVIPVAWVIARGPIRNWRARHATVRERAASEPVAPEARETEVMLTETDLLEVYVTP